MHTRTILRVAIVLIATALCSGCGSYLTSQEIDAFGTKEYAVMPKEQLVENIKLTLEGMGYEIIVADAGKGLVKTGRKLSRQLTQTSGTSSGSSTKIGDTGYTRNSGSSSSQSSTQGIFRQYEVRVTEHGKKLRVRVVPRVFINETDVSEDKVWKIEGDGGERQLWAAFFRDLESLN